MKNYEGKVAVITGSTLGIGKSIARALAEQGAKVVLNGRTVERLEAVRADFAQAGHTVAAIPGDVSQPEDCQNLIDQTIETFGRLDILITNAGMNMWGRVEDTEPLALKKVMDINFFGTIWTIQAAIPHLRQTHGSVIMIGSIAAFRGLPLNAVYSASKRALTPMAEAMKTELEGSGIHIGLAYVGLTEVEPEKKVLDTSGNPVSKPTIKSANPEPIENVTRRVLQMLERRTFKRTFTPLGKLNNLVNRIAPGIAQWALRRNYRKTSGF